MAALMRIPALAISPQEKPFQGRGKPDKILRNGRPNHSLADQLLKPGIGGHQTKVITKAFSREQKERVGQSAAIGAGLVPVLNPGTTKRAVQYGASSARLRVAGARTKDVAGKAQYLKDSKRMAGFAGRNVKSLAKPAAAWAGISAGVTAGSIAVNSRRQRRGQVAKMSDVELRRRKKAAGHIAVTTSTLGLGSLGALGAGAALKKPRLTKVAATGSIVSGGVGGAGGYNFAAIQRAESKRRPVAKAFSRKDKRDGAVGAAGAGAATGGALAWRKGDNRAYDGQVEAGIHSRNYSHANAMQRKHASQAKGLFDEAKNLSRVKPWVDVKSDHNREMYARLIRERGDEFLHEAKNSKAAREGLHAAHAAVRSGSKLRVRGMAGVAAGALTVAGAGTAAARRRRPVAKAFSPEGARHQRNKRQTQVAHGAGMVGAGGAGALVPVALLNNREGRALKRRSFTQVQDGFKDPKTGTRSARKVKNSLGDFSTPFFRHPNVGERAANGGARGAKLVGLARKQGKGAAAFAALGAGGLVASDRIASYSSGKGQTYKPRIARPE